MNINRKLDLKRRVGLVLDSGFVNVYNTNVECTNHNSMRA
jgi:hypothetical protein